MLNWRKDLGDGQYPGFSELSAEYERLWDLYRVYCEGKFKIAPSPAIAEFTYVNHIDVSQAGGMHDVVSLFRDADAKIPGENDITRFQFVRRVVQDDRNPYEAQIVIAGEPAVIEDRSHLLLTVAVKTIVAVPAIDLEPIKIAHALASHTFAAIVAEERQAEWGRIR